jgi:Flp pilus assembly protein TadG
MGARCARSRTAGISAIYLILFMVVICAFCSLAVDYGRVQLAKTELRRAADGAARAGAAGLVEDPGSAVQLAINFAKLNPVDGQPLQLKPSEDIELGKWDTKALTFKKLSGFDLDEANAVRVVAKRNQARGNAIPMTFASFIGFDACSISAESIVMVIPPIHVDQSVPATGNPFLAGMPAGASASVVNPHNSPDYAGTASNPRQSPLLVKLKVAEGQTLTFDSITGTARHDPNLAYFDPDGEMSDIGHNNVTKSGSNSYTSKMFNENGIADMVGPINALVGVFLTDDPPTKGDVPDNLDFRKAEDRDFDNLKPLTKQIFWIGDGENSKGNKQEFIVPKGATRLFLATWDFYEWNNNHGFRDVRINRPMHIITVK